MDEKGNTANIAVYDVRDKNGIVHVVDRALERQVAEPVDQPHVPERRHGDLHDLQAKEQILAEISVAHPLLEIVRGQDTSIDTQASSLKLAMPCSTGLPP